MSTKLDPVTRWVRSLPGKYYKLEEAATMLGVASKTLRRRMRQPGMAPSQVGLMGKRQVYLYTRADIERIRTRLAATRTVIDFHAAPRAVGRPPKWTEAQVMERNRLYGKRKYWQTRVEVLTATDRTEDLRRASQVVSQVQTTLDQMEPAHA